MKHDSNQPVAADMQTGRQADSKLEIGLTDQQAGNIFVCVYVPCCKQSLKYPPYYINLR